MNKWIEQKKLNASQLKWIAIITMTLDHFGKMFTGNWIIPIAQFLNFHPYYVYLGIFMLFAIGNMTVYIFIWFIAEGCRYTKDIRKYILRLLSFAILSEIPFQFLVSIIMGEPLVLHLGLTNVMVTFVLGVTSCYGYQILKEKECKYLCYLPPILFAIVAYVLQTDYNYFGVIAIFVLYIVKDVKNRLRALTLLILFFRGFYEPMIDIMTYGFALEMIPEYLCLLAFSLISVPLLSMYSGERGKTSTINKYIFYAYYPIHISVLVLLFLVFNH